MGQSVLPLRRTDGRASERTDEQTPVPWLREGKPAAQRGTRKKKKRRVRNDSNEKDLNNAQAKIKNRKETKVALF